MKNINRLTYLDEEANIEMWFFFPHPYWNMYCLCLPKTSWPLLHFCPYVKGRKALTNGLFPCRTLSFCTRYTFKAPTIKTHSGWQGPKTTCQPFRTIADIMKSSITKKEQTQSLEAKSASILRYSYNLLESKSPQKLPGSRDNRFPPLNTETENAMRGAASLLIYPTENG